MRTEEFIFNINNKDYKVFVTYKNVRNIYFRIKKDGFHVTASLLTSKRKIISGLEKFGPKLLSSFERGNSNYSFDEDYIYLLGKKESLKELNIKNIDELETFLKNMCLEYITILVRKYEQIMNINKPYKIGVRKTTSRFGSNSSKTHSLSFQIALIHYSEDIISSVVVHELAHDFHRNHQKGFYNCVYLYCPNYKELQRKLKKGIHS